MTKELLKELKIEFSDSSESLNSLQVKLKRGLIDKKFLLVLDDVWNRQYSDWNKLKILFQDGSKGSKIIVTTRDEKIARMMGQERSIHRLDIISKKDSWSLFEKHAFGDGDNENREELEEIGKKIVSKCKGLPLAVKTVAGLLRSTRMVEEWKHILENDVWNQTRNPDDILPALKLSYLHLPSHLKRCFAYCAVFHKDFRFRKEQIIQLWYANGLLEHLKDDKRILEDIGDEYLGELRMRSLLESTHNQFSMHDLINDLAKSVFGKFCLRLEDHDSRHGTVARVRNFTYYFGDNDTFDKFKLLRETENLTTFLPLYSSSWGRISNKFLHDMLPRFKSLRVLSLAGYNITKLPDSFIGLKQLRFLNLSFTKITKLPEWVCTLYNLQTLLLSNCEKLEELPIHLLKLINLCYLDISGTRLNKMPTQLGRLKNLQVLIGFVVGKDGGSGIQELGQFQKLSGKQLFISGLENVSCGRDASMANVKGMKHLEHLTLKWNGDAEGSQVARDVFDELQPHSGIKHLEINGYCGTRLPDWFGNPLFCHMKSISLNDCQYCFVLPPLGQLPSLESLEIVGMSKILALSREMYCGDNCEIKPFLSLKKLKIQNMEELERWDIPECETFCNIEELNITNCPRLVGKLPTNLSSLKILEISECDKLEIPNGQLGIFNGDIQQFSSLRELKVSGLQNLKELYAGPDSLPGLEELKIKNCKSLLPFRMGNLPAMLKTLEYDGCVSNLELQLLEGESNRGGTLIDRLTLRNLDSLKVASLGSFLRLKNVQISDCKMLSFGIPEGGLPAPNLTHLYLYKCEKLKSLPERMQSLLPSLRSLVIHNCPEIECFPEGGLPSSLEYLRIYNCKKLMSSSRVWDLPRLPSLRCFRIGGVDDESFPNEDLLLPRTLEDLDLWLIQNLKMLNYSGLRHLTCLNTLTIGHCPKIQSLPDEGLPASLTTLEIWECPLLKPRLEWEKGQDWPKVAHIPCVVVDGELFP
ncbi:hypothetical protein ACH5RR_028767 [Cinchona calisaya]|uniref:NB-ARC domain-containing protein n=1 Tax=Cinchona calisaya TaxID=153742 RepID=A0ABD2YRX9_9GENT